MFNEDIPSFLSDFGEYVIYSDGSYTRQILAIHSTDDYVDENGQPKNAFIIERDEDIVIGGEISTSSNTFIIDAQISDDGAIQVVSVVKQ